MCCQSKKIFRATNSCNGYKLQRNKKSIRILFKKEYSTYEIELYNGKKSKYNDEIKNRTMLMFAEVYQQFEKLSADIKKCDDMNDFIKLMYGSKAEEIMNEVE